MKIVLYFVGFLLIAATVLPMVRSEEWWIRGLDFPRMQISFLMFCVFFIAAYAFYNSLLFIDGVFALVILGCLAYQCYQIFPYTPLSSVQAVNAQGCRPSSSIRVLITNVLMTNRRADELIALVHENQPDLVLAVETDHWWDTQLSTLDKDYPFSIKHPRENTYGMHFFSKLKLTQPELRFLIEEDVPSVKAAIELASGEQIEFYGLHPRPPKPGQDTDERDAEILIVGKEVASGQRPAIIAGDLNDVAWSYTTRLFQRISGALDPRIGRGMFSTFHAEYPFMRWPLDHVFHDQTFTVNKIERLRYFGSDHFPVLADLCHGPRAASAQDAPDLDHGDREEAREKIEEGRH